MATSEPTLPDAMALGTSSDLNSEHSDGRFEDQARRRAVREHVGNKRLWIIGAAIAAGLAAWLVITT